VENKQGNHLESVKPVSQSFEPNSQEVLDDAEFGAWLLGKAEILKS
jgi:hypothetical protein